MNTMQLSLIEIRDCRQQEWFWIDNKFVDEYAKVLGPTATMVYLTLSRHADNGTQKCFPSMETIAEKIGLKDRHAVSRAVKKLQDHRIIDIEETVNPTNGHRRNNVYTLLAIKYWKLEEVPAPPKLESHKADTEPLFRVSKQGWKLPDWINPEVWDEWETYRSEIKKKLTKTTVARQLKFLEDHKADHAQIIANSIGNGWTGLFEIKKGNGKKTPNKVEAPAGKYGNLGEKI